MPDDSVFDDPAKESRPRHPPVETIEDVITFRLQRLVMIDERAGQDWVARLFGLTLNEWRLLALIRAHAPVRAGDMAVLMYMDKSQLSRLIKSLQAKKLIKNATDPGDGRAVALKPTKRGKLRHDKVLQEVLRRNEDMLSPLTRAEVAVFDGLLERVLEHNAALLMARDRNEG